MQRWHSLPPLCAALQSNNQKERPSPQRLVSTAAELPAGCSEAGSRHLTRHGFLGYCRSQNIFRPGEGRLGVYDPFKNWAAVTYLQAPLLEWYSAV